jgi:hypothetical protein
VASEQSVNPPRRRPTQLVTLVKERNDPLHALALGFVEIDPGKR